ncbi:hypothetical protein DUNSADRAFT_14780, partial [Dunaliella salina]
MDVHDRQPALGGTQDALALLLEAVLSAVRLLTQSLTSTSLSMGNICLRGVKELSVLSPSSLQGSLSTRSRAPVFWRPSQSEDPQQKQDSLQGVCTVAVAHHFDVLLSNPHHQALLLDLPRDLVQLVFDELERTGRLNYGHLRYLQDLDAARFHCCAE